MCSTSVAVVAWKKFSFLPKFAVKTQSMELTNIIYILKIKCPKNRTLPTFRTFSQFEWKDTVFNRTLLFLFSIRNNESTTLVLYNRLKWLLTQIESIVSIAVEMEMSSITRNTDSIFPMIRNFFRGKRSNKIRLNFINVCNQIPSSVKCCTWFSFTKTGSQYAIVNI